MHFRFAVVKRSLLRSGEPLRSFSGGLLVRPMFGGWNAGGPLMRLDVFDNFLRLEARSRILRWVTPTWEIHFRDVAEVQAIGSNRGVRLRTESGDGIIFRTVQREQLLQELTKLGLNVIAQPLRVR
jgi:hypothetical protein